MSEEGDVRWEKLKADITTHRVDIIGVLKELMPTSFGKFRGRYRDLPVYCMPIDSANNRRYVGLDIDTTENYTYRTEGDNFCSLHGLIDDDNMQILQDGRIKINPKRMYTYCDGIVFTPEGLAHHSSQEYSGEREGPLRAFLHEFGHLVVFYLAKIPSAAIECTIQGGLENHLSWDPRNYTNEFIRKLRQDDPFLYEFLRIYSTVRRLNEETAECFAVNTLYQLSRQKPKATVLWPSSFIEEAVSFSLSVIRERFRDFDVTLRKDYRLPPLTVKFLEGLGKIPIIKTKPRHAPKVEYRNVKEIVSLDALLFSP